jgi:hypothetical protein
MLQLELTKAVATLINFNPFTEKNGKDRVPATALRITAALTADVLAFFSPTLKAFLFNDAGPRDLADGLPLRDPHLEYPLKRDEQMTGATVTVDYGVNAPLVFTEAKLKNFQLTPKEGGTVVVAFTVLCKPDAEKEIPKLYLLQGQGITISIEPCKLPEMQEAA